MVDRTGAILIACTIGILGWALLANTVQRQVTSSNLDQAVESLNVNRGDLSEEQLQDLSRINATAEDIVRAGRALSGSIPGETASTGPDVEASPSVAAPPESVEPTSGSDERAFRFGASPLLTGLVTLAIVSTILGISFLILTAVREAKKKKSDLKWLKANPDILRDVIRSTFKELETQAWKHPDALTIHPDLRDVGVITFRNYLRSARFLDTSSS